MSNYDEDDEDNEDDEDEGFPFALNHLKTPTVDLRSLRVVCVLKNGCKCSTAKSCKIYFRIHFSRYLRQMPWTNSRGPSIKKRAQLSIAVGEAGPEVPLHPESGDGAEWGLQATTKMMSKWLWYLKKQPQKPWSSHLFPHWGGQFGGPSPILQACVLNVGSWRSCTPKCWLFCTMKA